MIFDLKDFLTCDKFKGQFDSLIKFLQGKKVILYNPDCLELVQSVCDLSRLNILGVSGRSLEKETSYSGFNVIKVRNIIDSNPDYIVVFSFDRLFSVVELRDVALNSDIKTISIYTDVSKPSIEYLETHIVDHCNLKCKSCAVYSPIASEKFCDILRFEQDFEELSKKVNVNCLRIMGGEPLLHPDVSKFLIVSRKYLPLTDIHLVTNGLLLAAMKDDFWAACRENNIKIDISIYPPFKDSQQQYVDLIKSNGATLGLINEIRGFKNAFLIKGYNDNVEAVYRTCWENMCLNLREGHIVTCPTACFSDYLNDYFGCDLPTEKGINIYENSGSQIVEYLNNPVEMCAYCALDKRHSVFQPWDYSKFELEEWVGGVTENA